MRAHSRAGGFTFAEILIAVVITALIAGGTMMAFVAAARMMRAGESPAVGEAADDAEETEEKFRNRIACDDDWFDLATCRPTNLPVGWTDDPLPASSPPSNSILNASPTRRYCITPADCDGDGTDGDCLTMKVEICWGGTPCAATCP